LIAAVPAAALSAPQSPAPDKSTLTLLEANLTVAKLGGFWARQADGHPGPDLMSRGLMLLNMLVAWEQIKKHPTPKKAAVKLPSRKPG